MQMSQLWYFTSVSPSYIRIVTKLDNQCQVMLGTLPLLVLISGAATAFSYPANYGGTVRRMKRSTSPSGKFPQEGGGNPPQDVTLKYLKTSRSAINPSCWFQYYTTCPRSSLLRQGQAEATTALSAAGRDFTGRDSNGGDSWQPVLVPAPPGSRGPSYRVLPGWAQLNSVRLF